MSKNHKLKYTNSGSTYHDKNDCPACECDIHCDGLNVNSVVTPTIHPPDMSQK